MDREREHGWLLRALIALAAVAALCGGTPRRGATPAELRAEAPGLNRR